MTDDELRCWVRAVPESFAVIAEQARLPLSRLLGFLNGQTVHRRAGLKMPVALDPYERIRLLGLAGANGNGE